MSDDRFNPWSFLRDVLVRGAAIEKDSQAEWRGYEAHSARLDAAARELADRLRPHLAAPAAPLDMVLPCPRCGLLHVDAPEPEKGWDNPPHKSHLCHGCGLVWRPADVPTNGVAAVKTRGQKDGPACDGSGLLAACDDAVAFVRYAREFFDWTRFPHLAESVGQLETRLAAALAIAKGGAA